MKLAPRDSRLAEAGQDPLDQSGRAADVDVAFGDVRDELLEVGRREEVACFGARVVADEVLDPGSAVGGDPVELVGEDDVGRSR